LTQRRTAMGKPQRTQRAQRAGKGKRASLRSRFIASPFSVPSVSSVASPFAFVAARGGLRTRGVGKKGGTDFLFKEGGTQRWHEKINVTMGFPPGDKKAA